MPISAGMFYCHLVHWISAWSQQEGSFYLFWQLCLTEIIKIEYKKTKELTFYIQSIVSLCKQYLEFLR